jgi:hypothetical protein
MFLAPYLALAVLRLPTLFADSDPVFLSKFKGFVFSLRFRDSLSSWLSIGR